MEDLDVPDVVRQPQEVATRALVVFSIMGLGFGAPKSEVVDWLDETRLKEELAPSEQAFLNASSPSDRQIINAQWLSERLVVLCWALGKLADLPPPDEQCDIATFQDILPPFVGMEAPHFIREARLRPDNVLIAMADTLLDYHWQARDTKLRGSKPRTPVDIGIIQERHRAINWVIGYDGAPWDEVTADT